MNGPQSWIASVVGALLGVLVVSVLVGPRLAHLAATRTASASLPPGVCALTIDKQTLADSTRLEAKLVTFASADGNDPNFPWHQYPPAPRPASWGRITPPPPTPLPAYYWVIAEQGTYVVAIPQPPPINQAAATGPPTFHNVLAYVSADTCEGRGFSASGRGGWPTWFDNMPAVVDIKFK